VAIFLVLISALHRATKHKNRPGIEKKVSKQSKHTVGLLRELWTQAAKLGSRQAHHNLGNIYYEGGDVKKAKFHYKAAAMDHETARFNLGCMEYKSGKVERAVKHWTIGASAGSYKSCIPCKWNSKKVMSVEMHSIQP
jgi:TPR repeat protein